MRLFPALLVLLMASALSSCAGVSNLQPQVNGLTIGGRFDDALKTLDNPSAYGKNNRLLWLFDRGMVQHFAGRYEDSFQTFEDAKLEYEQLYTESVSKISTSWLWNDYALPYRGEDFERVTVNVVQALNFLARDDLRGALVEVRDADSILNAINHQYPEQKKNVYRRDAFARLLAGLIYEADGQLNDALISYRMAYEAYEQDYKRHYGIGAPALLKENFLAAAEKFRDPRWSQLRAELADVQYVPWDTKRSMGQIVVIEHAGMAPMKLPAQYAIPLPDGYITQLAFPRYQSRGETLALTSVNVSSSGAIVASQSVELGQDIGAIAVKNLEDRKLRVMAKAVLRSAGKYAAQRALEHQVKKDHGENSASLVRIAGSLYNLFSERADVRSWLTLPAQIRVARLIVPPGEYDVTAGTGAGSARRVEVRAGQTRFLIIRTVR